MFTIAPYLQLWLVIILSLFGAPDHALWAADSPQAMIRATVQRTLAGLEDPTRQGTDQRRERIAKVKELILPHFDMEELARRTLGPYWSQRTAAEQQEFVRLLSALVERTYGSIIDRYAKDVQISYGQERLAGDSAEVDTQVRAPSQDRAIEIDYFLRQVNGQWLIYDLQIDNVSLALNYRNQFHRILTSSSYDDLVQRLKQKLQELDGASP